MEYIAILELPILIVMVIIRAVMLRKHGIKVIVFGKTDKSDFLIIPVVLCFFYGITAAIFDLPFPEILKKPFFSSVILHISAAIICSVSIIWFGLTLKTFGKSFRVGIDEKTNDELITNGVFSLSRNPIYLVFIVFFIGIFFSCPNITVTIFLLLLTSTIHRQILREEEFLSRHYKEKYENYCKKVRRYI